MGGGKKSGNGGKHWTDKEVKKYLEMRKKGYTNQQISKELPGRTERACQQFGKNGHTNGHKNGNGNKTKWGKEEIALSIRLHTEGKNYKEISEALLKNFGTVRNPGAVRIKINRMGTEEEEKQLARLYFMELSVDKIAEILQKNPKSVKKKLDSLEKENKLSKLIEQIIKEDAVFENEIKGVKLNTNEKLKL